MEAGAGLVGEIQMDMFFKHILINVKLQSESSEEKKCGPM